MPPIKLVIMTLASPNEPLSQLQQKKNRKSNKDGGLFLLVSHEKTRKWQSFQMPRATSPTFPHLKKGREAETATESVRTLDGAEAHNVSAG